MIKYVMGKVNNKREKKLIKIISYRKRLLDYGNLVGGAKPIPDALVALGWLWDDSPEWSEVVYEQVKVKNGERTEVVI